MSIEKDLETAKDELRRKSLTLVIVKDSKVIFESGTHGVSAFLEALENLGGEMEGASVADKVVGKAIALLCVYAGVKAVYTLTLSVNAKRVFEKYGVHFEWENLVEKILDSSGENVCPFEKATMKTDNPKKAYEKVKALLEALKDKR
ncbi:MAG: DUF1893 domain-containing protein [Candidatus Bathyarchaeia archaeon]